MQNNKTYYQLILDRSGSMGDCIQPTISGFNEQMDMIRDLRQKFPDQEIRVSLTQFNQEVEEAFAMQAPEKVAPLTVNNYRPAGMTALLDAVGQSVNALQLKIGSEIRDNLASAVVVIITDGYENASRRFTHRQIADLIRELESTGRWTFSYLGATLDAVEVAESMNIRGKNSMSYRKDQTAQTHQHLTNSMERYMRMKSQGHISRDFLMNDLDADAESPKK